MTDEDAREAARDRYLLDTCTERDDNAAAFEAGWDAARAHEDHEIRSGRG